jgi:hypothetical protein
MNTPEDLRYSSDHEWIRTEDAGNVRIGITDYAQDALGDVVFVERPKARRSKNLEEAKRIGAVKVTYIERSRMSKAPPRSPPPPNVRLPRGVGRKAAGTPPAAPAPVAGVDMGEIRRIAREEARAGAREGVAEGVEAGVKAALAGFQAPTGQAISQDMLEAALRNVLPSISVTNNAAPPSGARTAAKAPTGPEEPVFIPKSIVDKDAKAELKTEADEGADTGLDEAAAALKAAKGTGGRKKRTRKKPVAPKE